MVEENRSCPGDLPRCKNQCTLQDLQKRLMFVGDMPPADGQGVSGEGAVAPLVFTLALFLICVAKCIPVSNRFSDCLARSLGAEVRS